MLQCGWTACLYSVAGHSFYPQFIQPFLFLWKFVQLVRLGLLPTVTSDPVILQAKYS